MVSDNPSGGDNQQETGKLPTERSRLHPDWVLGFVDGEGCFSVAVHKNPYVRRTRGWQFLPTFQVAQHRDYRDVLEELVRFFGVGRVRDKGRDSAVLVYSVYGAENNARFIVPFFARHRLLVKQADFERFAAIVTSLRRREHLESDGFERLVRLAFGMNRNGKQRARTMEEVLRGSSETVREAPVSYAAAGDDPVRAAWRHAESGRNDLAALR